MFKLNISIFHSSYRRRIEWHWSQEHDLVCPSSWTWQWNIVTVIYNVVSIAQHSRRPWPCSLNETRRNNRDDVMSRHFTSRCLHSMYSILIHIQYALAQPDALVKRNELMNLSMFYYCWSESIWCLLKQCRHFNVTMVANAHTHMKNHVHSVLFASRIAYVLMWTCVCVSRVTFSPDSICLCRWLPFVYMHLSIDASFGNKQNFSGSFLGKENVEQLLLE